MQTNLSPQLILAKKKLIKSKRVSLGAIVPIAAAFAVTVLVGCAAPAEDTQGNEQLLVGSHPERIMSLAIFPNNNQVVTGGMDNVVRVWDLKTSRMVRSFAPFKSHPWSVAVSGPQSLVAAGCNDFKVRLLNFESGQIVRTLDFGGLVRAVAVSPDGAFLAAAGWNEMKDGRVNGAVKVWSLRDAKPIKSYTFPSMVRTVTFSSNGKELAAAGKDSIVYVWDTRSWKQTQSITGDGDSINTVVFAPNRKLIAYAGRSGLISIFDVKSRRVRRQFKSSSAAIQALSFSPDSTKLASGASLYGSLRIWNVEQPKMQEPTQSNLKDINAISFDSTGKNVIFSSGQELMKWNLTEGVESTRALIK